MSPLPDDLAPVTLTRYWRTPSCDCRGSICVLSQGLRIRQAGLIGDEILSAHDYRDRGSDGCRLLLSLVLFSLVVHTL
jgi:hypothetical protein